MVFFCQYWRKADNCPPQGVQAKLALFILNIYNIRACTVSCNTLILKFLQVVVILSYSPMSMVGKLYSEGLPVNYSLCKKEGPCWHMRLVWKEKTHTQWMELLAFFSSFSLFQVSYCTSIFYRMSCVVALIACSACQSKQVGNIKMEG